MSRSVHGTTCDYHCAMNVILKIKYSKQTFSKINTLKKYTQIYYFILCFSLLLLIWLRHMYFIFTNLLFCFLQQLELSFQNTLSCQYSTLRRIYQNSVLKSQKQTSKTQKCKQTKNKFVSQNKSRQVMKQLTSSRIIQPKTTSH